MVYGPFFSLSRQVLSDNTVANMDICCHFICDNTRVQPLPRQHSEYQAALVLSQFSTENYKHLSVALVVLDFFYGPE